MGFLDIFSKKAQRRAGGEPADANFSDPAYCKRVVYAYHEQTKHGFQRFAAGPGAVSMITGSVPATAVMTTRARGFMPWALA